MLLIYAFLLGPFVQPGFFQCSDGEIGQILPGDTCDNKRCLSLSQETFETVGTKDLKTYTWTKGDEGLIGYCPLNLNFSFAPIPYETAMNVTLTFTTRSGKDCDSVKTASRYYTAEPDPVSGNYTLFTRKEGSEMWQFCHQFQIYDGALACRSCRIDPPPEAGNGYGFIYVFYRPKGDCQLDAINEYLADSDVYWEEIGVTCPSKA